MKAVRIHQYGGIEVVKYEDAPIPRIKPDEVLIKVAATSFNPVDILLRQGAFKSFMPLEFPYTLGLDVAGVIEKTGTEVNSVKKGDRVFAFLEYDKNGAAAEYVATKASYVVEAPCSIELTESAAIPLVALTAWQGLFQHGNLRTGQRVLITAASGGVGSFAVQFAKLKGAYVIGTSSEKSISSLREFGTDEEIDYNKEKPQDLISEKVDMVFNLAPLSKEEVNDILSIIKPGGMLVSALTPADENLGKAKDIKTLRMTVGINPSQLKEIAELVDQGKVKVHISETLPLEKILQAHEKAEAKKTRGKIVIRV